MFADDTSIFSVTNDPSLSAATLNNDLKLISKLVYQLKMNFNPDLNKQAPETIFSQKYKKVNHPAVCFNNVPVSQAASQKHLGVILDEKLSFDSHLQENFKKANIELLKLSTDD